MISESTGALPEDYSSMEKIRRIWSHPAIMRFLPAAVQHICFMRRAENQKEQSFTTNLYNLYVFVCRV